MGGATVPECGHPKCHEDMTTAINDRPTWRDLKDELKVLKELIETKLSKNAMVWFWIVFSVIGIPLSGSAATIAISMWVKQNRAELQYATKEACTANSIRLEKLEESRVAFRRDVTDMKQNLDWIVKTMQKVGLRDEGER